MLTLAVGNKIHNHVTGHTFTVIKVDPNDEELPYEVEYCVGQFADGSPKFDSCWITNWMLAWLLSAPNVMILK